MALPCQAQVRCIKRPSVRPSVRAVLVPPLLSRPPRLSLGEAIARRDGPTEGGWTDGRGNALCIVHACRRHRRRRPLPPVPPASAKIILPSFLPGSRAGKMVSCNPHHVSARAVSRPRGCVISGSRVLRIPLGVVHDLFSPRDPNGLPPPPPPAAAVARGHYTNGLAWPRPLPGRECK